MLLFLFAFFVFAVSNSMTEEAILVLFMILRVPSLLRCVLRSRLNII
jgi:hypothetical protein